MNYTTGIITFDFNDNAMSLAANSKIIFADIWSLKGDEYLNYFIICWIEDIENNDEHQLKCAIIDTYGRLNKSFIIAEGVDLFFPIFKNLPLQAMRLTGLLDIKANTLIFKLKNDN